uniref:Uncharacterized protein n=1 Tax=Anguilla anguilla TaxID=7936 RepID=A0A0E9UH16_ANGAN
MSIEQDFFLFNHYKVSHYKQFRLIGTSVLLQV